jgi:hypothetical protein
MLNFKGFFKSKIVWASLLGTIIAIYNHFAIQDVNPEVVPMIVNIDYANLGLGTISALVGIWRVFFTNTVISGLF